MAADGVVGPVPTSAPAPLLPAPRRTPEGAAGEVARPVLRERPRRRSRSSAVVVAVLLGALVTSLVAALALAGHLWGVSAAWQSQARDAELQRDRLASTSLELQHRLDEVQAALDASDARVEQLAAEKARAADLHEASTR